MYDYVIVGAGSAGCVLAARLCEDSDARVALIESGDHDTQPEIHIPVAFPALFKSGLDWDLLGEPEPGLGGRRLYLPRGRMLGGCSSINAMIYIRGNRVDYDGWAASGGWGYDGRASVLQALGGQRARRGCLPRRRRTAERCPRVALDARPRRRNARGRPQAGHERNPDFNGARQEGVGRFQLTQRDGMRWSTADAFLRPALERGVST